LKKAEEAKSRKFNKIEHDNEFVHDTDEKWEQQFLKIVEETKNQEIILLEEKKNKKRTKKESKKKKKEIKKEKELKKKNKTEEDLIELYKSYGMSDI
jgi:fructose-1,6-bisphosphatase/inositol monophosphatase family enzyme